MSDNQADTRAEGGDTKFVLREGETCWRKAQANRVSFIIDAADYFAAAKSAILKARRAVYLIGWEFDLSIRLRPGDEEPEAPDQLRRFLVHAAKERPDLEIFILQWDGAMVLNIARQIGPFLLLKSQVKPQIHFRLDNTHPAGACHHQKIVVIDDVLAFCGGIDMTAGRWDTPRHTPDDERRTNDGPAPMPWHDMTMAVDGEVAKVLGELARWRWKRATGKELPVPDQENDIWPHELPVDCRNVKVGIARTLPSLRDDDEEAICEIERLWIEAIGSARRTIYIENQFLSSGRIAEALKARLRERDGPEIVIVLPESAESWLESEVMDSARSLIISDLKAADKQERLGIYHPVNAANQPVYVHAKALIVDDCLVRVGSSNMSTRSMAFDSECDLVIEAEDQQTRSTILDLRNKLVAEHLGASTEGFAAVLLRTEGSVLRAIKVLQQESGPTLRPLEPRPLNETEIALAKSRLLDPEGQRKPSERLADFLRRAAAKNQIPITVAGTLLANWAVRRVIRGVR